MNRIFVFGLFLMISAAGLTASWFLWFYSLIDPQFYPRFFFTMGCLVVVWAASFAGYILAFRAKDEPVPLKAVRHTVNRPTNPPVC